MLRKAALCLVAMALATVGSAQQDHPHGIPHLDHVFLIMMENQKASRPFVQRPFFMLLSRYGK